MIDFYRLLDGFKGNVKEVGKLTWKGGSRGIFTVKSAYGILKKSEQQHFWDMELEAHFEGEHTTHNGMFLLAGL